MPSSLNDWLGRIERLSPQEIVLGLDRVVDVLNRIDATLPGTVLHVAGTNGKGSTVAYLEAILAGSGAKVGAYTSPHMLRYNERIRVGGNPAADADIVAAFERIEAARDRTPLTYFEYGTLAALSVFETLKVDIAVLEVGMGGRLDAVNAIEPAAGIITTVALDHCDWLGDDIETIAAEKAGIMRAGRPIVYGSRDAPDMIHRRAAALGADLVLAGRDFDWRDDKPGWSWRGKRIALDGLEYPALAGPVQVQNAAGALALLEVAGYGELLDADPVNAALRGVSLSGRMQSVHAGATFLLDVAHNPAAAAALADALAERGFAGRTVAVIGALDDKDIEEIVAPLEPWVDRWIAVTAAADRAIPAPELARRVANAINAGCLEVASIPEAIDEARAMAGEGDRILITGSFYVVGPALETLGLYSPR